MPKAKRFKEVSRKLQIREILRIIRTSHKEGQIIIFQGYAGAGKSTILIQLEKLLMSKDRYRTIPIIIRVSEYDTDYEHSLYIMLRDKITGKLRKWFRRFVESVNIGYILEIGGKSLVREEVAFPRKILGNFIEDLRRFSDKGKEKLLIAFDDYHKASGKVFGSMIKEIAKSLPRNITLLIATRRSLKKEFTKEGIGCHVIPVPFFTKDQTTYFLEKNLNLKGENLVLLTRVMQNKLKGHPRSIGQAVLLSKTKKKDIMELLAEIPKRGWEEATYCISREVIDALRNDERTLVESCFALPYLDNDICSFVLDIRSAFPTLSRLEEKLLIRKKDSIYEMEDLTKEYLDQVVPDKKPIYFRYFQFFEKRARESKKQGKRSEGSTFGLYACDFLVKCEEFDGLCKFIYDFGEIFLQSGLFREPTKYLEIALKQCSDSQMKAHMLSISGDFCRMLGEFGMALGRYEEAKAISEELGDIYGKAWNLRGIAETHRMMGKYTDALKEYQFAHEDFEQIKGLEGLQGKGWASWGMARSCRSLGRYPEALEHYENARNIAIETQDSYLKELSTWGVAETYRSIDWYEEALGRYEEAKAISEELGDIYGKAWNLRGIAECHRAIGLSTQALKDLKLANDIFQRTGEIHGMAWNSWSIAETYRILGEHHKSLKHYEKTIEIANRAQAKRCLGWTHRGVAEVYRINGEYAEARKEYDKAKNIATSIGDRKGELRVLLGLAEILRMEGSYEDSLELCMVAKRLASDIGVKVETANTFLCIAEINRKQNKIDLTRYNEAIKVYNCVKVNLGVVYALIGRGLAFFQLGRMKDGERDLKDARRMSEKFAFIPEIKLIYNIKEEKRDEIHALKFL